MGFLFSRDCRRWFATLSLVAMALLWSAAGEGFSGGGLGLGARAASAATPVKTYTVRRGDTLSGIARRFGVSVKQIQAWSGLRTTLIRPGQRLVVGRGTSAPDAGYDPRLLHVVRQGETIEVLAGRYGLTPQEILAANPGKSVAEGATLLMPWPSQPVAPLARDPNLPRSLVAGYYVKLSLEDSLASSTVKENCEFLDLLIFASHRIRPDGSIDGTLYPDQREAAALNRGRFLIMFTNLNGGRFDRYLIHNVLRNPELRKRAVAGILDTVRSEKALGADIDFENIPPEDRRYLSQFIRELADALHPEGFLVTASVPAKLCENLAHAWSGAFDYPPLAQMCDLLFVMAYDQHYSTGYAGPIAGIDWVRAVVNYAVTAIPAEKLVLGTPSYGYDWRVGMRGARAVPAFKALEIATARGIKVSRHAEGQVPFFNYKDGRVKRVIYFEDADSLACKLDLVRSVGLRGIVFWRLGYEDPRVWDVIAMKP